MDFIHFPSFIIDHPLNAVHIYFFWGPIDLFRGFDTNFKQDHRLSIVEEV